MIYFTSDLHLGHNAIINIVNRPFNNVEEMNNALINNINSFVNNNDTLYILGDISHKLTVDESNELIRRINGKKILIKGNHDKEFDKSLFEGIYDYLEINLNNRNIILMHYPLKTWKNNRRGSIQLHGHIHAPKEYNEFNKKHGIYQYDVGVDANGYYPISIDYIIDYFSDSNLRVFDHHDYDEFMKIK